jgi:hypothetical protein
MLDGLHRKGGTRDRRLMDGNPIEVLIGVGDHREIDPCQDLIGPQSYYCIYVGAARPD